MPLTILHLFPNQLSPKPTPRFLVRQGEIRSQRQARQRRDRPAYPFRLSRRQQPGTARTNSKRPTHFLPNLFSALCANPTSTPIKLCTAAAGFRAEFPNLLSVGDQEKSRRNCTRESNPPPGRSCPLHSNSSRILRCPHPNRAKRSCHELRNLPILSENPLNLQPSSRNLHVPLLRLVPHPARQPTRMLLPKIALHTTIHRSSHFLRLQRIGSPRHQGTSAIILP
jgi:hypothetical protein